MKKLIFLGFLLVLLGVIITYKEELDDVYQKIVAKFQDRNVSIGEVNNYYRDYDFEFVQTTNDFIPESRQDLLNIYYTAINAGKSEFTFYCPEEYDECLDEIEELANDQTLLSHINNFVHPFNGFNNIETEYDTLGRVLIRIQKSYTSKQIEEISKEVKRLENELIVNSDTDLENIKRVHDYIIEHSKYDSDRSDRNIITYASDIAYGPLFEGYGICGGYTDAMQLFLENMGIKSYKVSSDKHVWNAVYLDKKWEHLDLTWDDPVTTNGKDILDHGFFMISTFELLEKEATEHNFNQEIYSELKTS